MSDCPICYDKYTAQVRKPVKCNYCDFAGCVPCVKRYLLESSLDAHCMNCKRGWNDDFIDTNFTRTFRTGAWKKHREDILMDRELSLLPTRQVRVEATLKRRSFETQTNELTQELIQLQQIEREIQYKIQRIHTKITRYDYEARGLQPPNWTLDQAEQNKPKQEKAKFIMKCPSEGGDCRGFLSTQYKCGTCQKWICPDCLEVKGEEKDDAHICNEERKQSVALIIKESKPCPKCGCRISKVDGCDMMWCTDCNTAFSWNTGQVVNGVVHNPHYYEYLRKLGNGTAPRNAGDVPCGGVPQYYNLIHALRNLLNPTQQMIQNIHRVTSEIMDQRLRQYQNAFDQEENGDLGVQYLMKEITKDEMKAELARREVKRNKQVAIRAILEMFGTTSTMMLIQIVNNPPVSEKAFQKTVNEYINLRDYVNDSLQNIGRLKGCSVPQIHPENWLWIQSYKPVSSRVLNKIHQEAEEEQIRINKEAQEQLNGETEETRHNNGSSSNMVEK